MILKVRVPTRGFLLTWGTVVPRQARTRNVCFVRVRGRKQMAPDGVLALLVGVPTGKLENVYELNPELFGLSRGSCGWGRFLAVREEWDAGTISWEDAVNEMVRCIPEKFSLYDGEMDVSFVNGVANGHT